jgi:hypothetical protein
MQQSKQKMQDVSFRNVEEFLEFLPDDELKIVTLLRSTVFNCVPNITEKLSYNVPFYKKNKGMFFIWPASILWGTKKTYQGVRFGFQQGNLLNDELNFLDRGERKQVYMKDYKNIEEIDLAILKTYIFEADLIDEQFNRKNHHGLQ